MEGNTSMFIHCRMKLKGTVCSMIYADSDSSIFEFGIDEFKKLVEHSIYLVEFEQLYEWFVLFSIRTLMNSGVFDRNRLVSWSGLKCMLLQLDGRLSHPYPWTNARENLSVSVRDALRKLIQKSICPASILILWCLESRIGSCSLNKRPPNPIIRRAQGRSSCLQI